MRNKCDGYGNSNGHFFFILRKKNSRNNDWDVGRFGYEGGAVLEGEKKKWREKIDG